MDREEGRASRPQTYQLRGKYPYARVGARFVAEASILAGTPRRRMQLDPYLQLSYDPVSHIAANDPVDRYAAVKALPYRPNQRREAVDLIEHRLDVEADERVLIEAAGAGTTLGSAKARDRLEGFIWSQSRADLRMETVFILTELHGPGSREILLSVANDPTFAEDEIRQAAVWGLGKTGLRAYADLLPLLGDNERDVVLHAVAAFGPDTPRPVVEKLVAQLVQGPPERWSAASEALRSIGSPDALAALIAAARQSGANVWVLATLGRMPANAVRAALTGDPLLERLEPLLVLSPETNWLAEDVVDIDLKFLLKQNL